MSKQEFLAELRTKLSGIPQGDIEERISFYSEMIDDRVEEGLTEEQAVAKLGTLEGITQQIMSEIPLTRLVKEKVRPNRTLRAWEIVLLVLGLPMWLPLLIALLGIVFSVYLVIWSLIFSVWAIEASIAACSLDGALSAIIFIAQGNITPGIAMFGAGILCAGLAMFGFFGCKCATGAILRVSKKIFIWIKSCFIKKEVVK